MSEPCAAAETKKDPNNFCKLTGVIDWQETKVVESKRRVREKRRARVALTLTGSQGERGQGLDCRWRKLRGNDEGGEADDRVRIVGLLGGLESFHHRLRLRALHLEPRPQTHAHQLEPRWYAERHRPASALELLSAGWCAYSLVSTGVPQARLSATTRGMPSLMAGTIVMRARW